MPGIAGPRLLQWLVANFPQSQHLLRVALLRIVPRDDPIEAYPSMATIIDSAGAGEDVLFAQERQNLYRDDSLEVRTWSQLLLRLQPTSEHYHILQRLTEWVHASISQLERTAVTKEDGPMGWSRNGGTFVAGLRVIYTAECLLCWARRNRDLQLRPGETRKHLVRLLTIGRERGVHPLWLEQLGKVLVRDLSRGTVRVGRHLAFVKGQLGGSG